MPLEKNQSLTLLFQSRRTSGTANSTVAPTLTISKDGAAGVALAAPTLVEGMALTWSITLTAAQMNCTALAIEHGGAGLEAWGTTIYPEAAYTSAGGSNLANLDAKISDVPQGNWEYLQGNNNTAEVNPANIASFAENASEQIVDIKLSADAAARPGAEMALTAAARTAMSDRIERAGGTLMVTKAGVDSLNTTAGQINAKTANLPASPAAVGSPMTLTPAERTAVADAYLDRADGIETGWTPRQISRVLAAVLAGKAGGADSDNPFFRSLNDLKTRVAAVVDEDGNRISVTYDVS